MVKDVGIKFSIIVPVYNTAQYLKRCLDSLINQTYQNIEIILVDDGSTDDSPNICDEYAKKYEYVRVIHKENGGQGSARNAGLKHVTGDYISFVDSDDYVSLQLYENCANLIQKIGADMICYKLICGMEENYQFEVPSDAIEVIDGISFLRRIYEYDNFDSSVLKIFKCSLFQQIFFPEGRTKGEDAGTVYKLVYKASKIILTSNVLYYYYQSKTSTMRGHFSLDKVQECDSFKERLLFFQEIGEQKLFERAMLQYEAVVLKNYYLVLKYFSAEKEVKEQLVGELLYLKTNIRKLESIKWIIKNIYFIVLCFPYTAGSIINRLI